MLGAAARVSTTVGSVVVMGSSPFLGVEDAVAAGARAWHAVVQAAAAASEGEWSGRSEAVGAGARQRWPVQQAADETYEGEQGGRRLGQQDAVGSDQRRGGVAAQGVRGYARHVPYGVGPGGQVLDGDGVEQGRERFLVDCSEVGESQVEGAGGGQAPPQPVGRQVGDAASERGAGQGDRPEPGGGAQVQDGGRNPGLVDAQPPGDGFYAAPACRCVRTGRSADGSPPLRGAGGWPRRGPMVEIRARASGVRVVVTTSAPSA